MTNRNRDSGDDLIARIVAWLIGLLVSAGLGHWLGLKQRQQLEALAFQLPDALEEQDAPSAAALALGLPWYLKYADALKGALRFVALTFGAFGVLSVFGNFFIGLVLGGIAFGSVWGARWLDAERVAFLTPPAASYNIAGLDLRAATAYTIRLPRTTEQNVALMGRFMEQVLVKAGGRLTFQIVAENGELTWRLLDLRQQLKPAVIRNAIHAFYPAAAVEEGPVEEPTFEEPFYRYVMGFRQTTNFLFPIRYAESLKQGDPLDTITHEMGMLGPGERMVYTLVVTDVAQAVYEQAEQRLTREEVDNPLWKFTAGGLADASFRAASGRQKARVPVYESKDEEVIITKLNNLCFYSLLMIQIDAPTRERVVDLSHIDSQLLQYREGLHNGLEWVAQDLPGNVQQVMDERRAAGSSALGQLDRWLTNRSREWKAYRLILDTRELAALWHLPDRSFVAGGIGWVEKRQVRMPVKMAGCREGVCLGVNRFAGQEQVVALPERDRATHMQIIGRTGMGKSTLLHRIIHQDIAAGRGVCVIDPHGDLVRDVLRHSIPPEREGEVVVLDLADEAYPPPMNPLARPKGMESGNAVGRVMAVLDRVYGGFAEAPRTADALAAALVTLWEEDRPTVRDVSRLFTDEDYRDRLLGRLDDLVTEEFWDSYERQSAGQREQISYPVLHRVRQFYRNRVLYPVMCHPQTLDWAGLIEQGKVILVSLATDEARVPPQEQQLLGAVLVAQIQMAVMGSPARKTPYYLYIDEAQRLVTTALDQMLSEARKKNLALTLANQYFEQLAGATLHAVMGNVGAIVAFQCHHEDARVLGPYLKPSFMAEDLVNLDKYSAALWMRFEGETQPAFSLTTVGRREGDPEVESANEERIRALSRGQYTPQSREEVLAWLNERYPRRTWRRGPQQADEGLFFEPADAVDLRDDGQSGDASAA